MLPKNNIQTMAYVNKNYSTTSSLESFNEDSCMRQSNISIAWRNLCCDTWEYGRRKIILNRLNGSFQTGSLNGLLGPSGAGKTTFLNCISGNALSDMSKESEIFVNSNLSSMVTYFVEQHVHENIIGRFTIRDILRYAYWFKNGTNDSTAYVDQFILKILDELLLPMDILDRQFVKCSGGEQKRIAVGQELMCRQKPSFLIIDEPTTGLDSTAAYEVINCLKQLTMKYQITVISSIHVPNHETLALYDKIYVLAKGGVAIYSGPPEGIQNHLSTCVSITVPEDELPIESIVRLGCFGINDPLVTKLGNVVQMDEYRTVGEQTPYLKQISGGLPSPRKKFLFLDLYLQTCRQMKITFVANFHLLFFVTVMMVLYFAMLAAIFDSQMFSSSACFNKVSHNLTCSEIIHEDIFIRENVNYLCYVLLCTGMIIIGSSALLFSSFVKVFRNEYRNYWYSMFVFYWSVFVVSFIELTLFSAWVAFLSYFFPAQHTIDNNTVNWNRFGQYSLFIFLMCYFMQSYGQLIGLILVDYVERATIICLILQALFALMNGIFVDLERNDSWAIKIISSAISYKYVSYGILNSIYVVDRCDWNTEDSIIVQLFELDLNGVPRYAQYVFFNLAIIRLLTIAFMYMKFHNFDHQLMTRLFRKLNLSHSNDDEISTQMEPIKDEPIDADFLTVCNNNFQTRKISNASYVGSISNYSKRGKPIIGWRNLTLYESSSSVLDTGILRNAEGRKSILRNLNGEFRFGTLNALMGTSGAGKTSLLKVLNGRCKTRLCDETRFYLSNSVKIEPCFITQEVSGHLMSGLTARQMVIYAARIKNPKGNVDCETIADEVLSELELSDIKNTNVERCSGGERKRLAIALELTSQTHMPNLICIDEPTSGLDSNSAETVIAFLRRLTHSHPMTIIASIHQPNTNILNLCDQLYVLARGGICIYAGGPSKVYSFLTELPDAKPSDPRYAIEDLIRISSCSIDNKLVQSMAKLVETKNSKSLPEETHLVPDGVQKNRRRFSLMVMYILTQRYFCYFRGTLWKFWLFFMINYFFYGISLRIFYDKSMVYYSGCISLEDDFNQICSRSQKSVDEMSLMLNNFKYNFFFATFFLFFILVQFSLNFLLELQLFTNEHRNGWYSSGVFYLMKSLFDLIPLLIIIAIYVYIGDWYEEIRPGIYYHFFYIFVLGAIAFQGIAHVIAIVSNNSINILIILCVAMLAISTILSNFLLTYDRMHYISQFISNFTVARSMFEAVILLQYGFGRCRPNEIQQLLYALSLKDADYYQCIIMLVFNIVLYRIIAILLLIYRINPADNRRQRATKINRYMDQLNHPNVQIPGLPSTDEQFRINIVRV